MSQVRKAVLPVAGLGTRIQPAAKTTPKNMLNLFDRPILAYILDEGRAAGIEHFIFIVGRGQSAIEDYFDHQMELEADLLAKGKDAILALAQNDLAQPGELSFVRQMRPLGLGHAVWCAREIIGDEPFAVMLPDMLMDANPPALKQAVTAFEAHGGNIVIVEPAPEGETDKYGIVSLGDTFGGGVSRMTGMVEKPPLGTEPSNLFISGRYILQPQIFDHLARHQKGAGGEIQLTDAMLSLMAEQEFFALQYQGTTYDCGDPVGLLRANVAYGLRHPTLGAEAREQIEAVMRAGP